MKVHSLVSKVDAPILRTKLPDAADRNGINRGVGKYSALFHYEYFIINSLQHRNVLPHVDIISYTRPYAWQI